MYGQFLKEAFIDGVTEHEPTIVITDSIRELLGSATAEFAMKYK